MRKTYSEKLKDPRWQKKRLQVLERAGWACECCGATDKTLNVHHGMYRRGAEPWEYPLETLWSLCKDCHDRAEDLRHDLYMEVACINPLRLGPHRIERDSSDEAESLRRGNLIRASAGAAPREQPCAAEGVQ